MASLRHSTVGLGLLRLGKQRFRIALAQLGLAGCCFARVAGAEGASEPVELRYAAPSVCPTEEQFTWQVTSRVAEVRAPRDDEIPRVFAARIELTPEGAIGRLTITEPSGEESSRLVESENCEDLVEALALVVALAIDPHASLQSPKPPPEPPPEPLPEPEPPPPPPAPPPQPPAEPVEWQAEVLVHAILAAGLAPGPLPGARIGAGFGTTSPGWLLPSVRVSVALTTERTFVEEAGSASFRWTALSLEACPLQVPLLPRVVSVRPCAVGEWGWVQATGAEIVDSRSVSARWLAAGGLASLGVSPGRLLRFEARASAISPITRDRFFLGTELAHRHPPFAWRTEIGFGVRFP